MGKIGENGFGDEDATKKLSRRSLASKRALVLSPCRTKSSEYERADPYTVLESSLSSCRPALTRLIRIDHPRMVSQPTNRARSVSEQGRTSSQTTLVHPDLSLHNPVRVGVLPANRISAFSRSWVA